MKAKTKAGTSKRSAEDKKRLFVEVYLSNGGNATDAALAVGYKKAGAGVQGCRMLKDAKVQAILSKRTGEVFDTFQITTERTLRELARLAYSDIRKLFNEDGSMKAINELDDDTAAAIASIETDEIRVDGTVVGYTRKIKLNDKRGALDMAMKHRGLYELDNEQIANPLTELIEKISAGGSRFKVAGGRT